MDIPTTEFVNHQQALLGNVILRGDPAFDGGCVWVERDDGSRIAVVWPPGFRARFTQAGVELLDRQGVVVAHGGDRLDLGGGYHIESPARCHVGEPGAFVAGSVRLAR